MVTAGWREWVDLPDWGIRHVRAKLDTGARTSALHVAHIELLPDGTVAFHAVPRRKSERRVQLIAEVVRRTRVRSSNGEAMLRPVVKTRLHLGPIVREIEVTLVDRAPMLHRMLLGRSALDGFIIDPARRYVISGKERG